MRQQREETDFLRTKLFDNFTLSKLKPLEQQAPPPTLFDNQNCLSYSDYMLRLVTKCRQQIGKTFESYPQIDVFNFLSKESLTRKVTHALMLLMKDALFLISEGILNLYMDFVELNQQWQSQTNCQDEVNFIQKIIGALEPMLYEFFVIREFKKTKKNPSLNQNQATSLPKNTLNYQQSDWEFNVFPSQSSYQEVNQQQFQMIRKEIKKMKINNLLNDYLKYFLQYFSDFQIEFNQTKEVCKICEKNIKLSHLQVHVKYCQKKQIIKQDLKSFQKKIVESANSIIQKSQNLQNEVFCLIKKESNTPNRFHDKNEKFIEVLNEIINVHKNGLLKNSNSTSRKVKFQYKSKENIQKYEDLVKKLLYFSDQNLTDPGFSQIQLLTNIQKQILKLSLQLKAVQLQYKHLQQLGSSSTLDSPSNTSTNKISEKKSRFAHNKMLAIQNQTKNYFHCSKNASKSIKNRSKTSQQLCKYQDFCIQDLSKKTSKRDQNFENQNEINEQNQAIFTFKTELSLQNHRKNVHLHDQLNEQRVCKEKNSSAERFESHRVKSLIMFDNSDSSQNLYEIENKIFQQSNKNENVCVDDFQILNFLGKGAFGKVYVVRKKNTEDLYALKMVHIDESWQIKDFQQIKNQHQIFKKVAGQHLVQAPYCFSQGGAHIFIMEYMPGGDLSKVLQEEVYLEENRARHVIAEIVLAIEHLHRADIIHRDLKPQNLVIDDQGHLKLTDFGLSQIKLQNKMEKVFNAKKQKEEKLSSRRKTRRTGIVASKQKSQIIGTPDYIAPEIINGVSISNRSIDWWSLGVISYEILIGVRPFCGQSIEEVLSNISMFKIEWPEIGDEEGMISERAYDFILRLLNRDFVNRLGAENVNQIKEHPFFSGVNWQNLKYEQAHITPNFEKIKQLQSVTENIELRKEIELKVCKKMPNQKMLNLENFVRFDILGEKTVKEAKKVHSSKAQTLKRLKSIKEIITNQENGPKDVSGHRKTNKKRNRQSRNIKQLVAINFLQDECT